MNPFRRLLYVFSGLLLITPWLTQAGDIDSPAPPDDEISAMFTLPDIHDRLNDGSAGAQRGALFQDPISGPGASVSANLNDIMGVAPSADPINGAAADQVLQGHTFWGLDRAAVWGPATGSMPNIGAQAITPGTTAQGITTGFHDGAGSVAGDADLIAGNIATGIKIFGVAGAAIQATGKATSAQVLKGVSFSNRDGPATGAMPDSSTGLLTPGVAAQAIPAGFHDGNGSVAGDADLVTGNIRAGANLFGVAGGLHAGVTCTGTLNGTRWCDNENGTVTDLSNGLVWLKDTSCVGDAPWSEPAGGVPAGAHTRASNLFDGSTLISGGDCGLTDSSAEGDWRLPTLGELKMLTTGTEPVLFATQHAFENVQNSFYWSSSSFALDPSFARLWSLNNGLVGVAAKTSTYPVWSVRGGQ